MTLVLSSFGKSCKFEAFHQSFNPICIFIVFRCAGNDFTRCPGHEQWSNVS